MEEGRIHHRLMKKRWAICAVVWEWGNPTGQPRFFWSRFVGTGHERSKQWYWNDHDSSKSWTSRFTKFRDGITCFLLGIPPPESADAGVLAAHKYSRTPIIRIDWDGEPSRYAENPDNWIFLCK